MGTLGLVIDQTIPPIENWFASSKYNYWSLAGSLVAGEGSGECSSLCFYLVSLFCASPLRLCFCKTWERFGWMSRPPAKRIDE